MKIYYFAAVAHVSGETNWGAAWLRCGDLPFLPTPVWAAHARCGVVLTTTRRMKGLWLLCGVFLPVSKIFLELRSSDTAVVCFLAAAHGKTGRGAAEVWGKGKRSLVGPPHPVQALDRGLALGGMSPGRDCHVSDSGYPQLWGHECITSDVLPPASVSGCSQKAPLCCRKWWPSGTGGGVPVQSTGTYFSAKPNSRSLCRSSTSRVLWINSTKLSSWQRCVAAPSGRTNWVFRYCAQASGMPD